MFEHDADTTGGSELAFNTYPSLADVLADTNGTSQFSTINVNPVFSTTGITRDGSQFIVMFEHDADTTGGSELAFNTYPSLADVLADTNTTSQFSTINVNPVFSTTGITWDGSQFIVMFEHDADTTGGSELAFNTYPSLADVLAGTNTTSQFSTINVNPVFSTTGITWDGSQFIVMFEHDADTTGGSELAFNTYPSLADLLAGTNTTSQFSTINVNPVFSTTGLWTVQNVSPTGETPLPAALPLFASGLGAMGLLGWRRKRKKTSALAA